MNYATPEGNETVSDVHGYYFELDYGKQHDLIDFLEYVQLFDIPGMRTMNRKGSITVKATGASGSCTFNYVLDNYRADSGPDILG